MNTPEMINIEKYAEALNNLIGIDIGYLGDSDESVNAIVEIIRTAKQLENRVKELTEENEKIVKEFSEKLKAKVNNLEFRANTKRKTISVDLLREQMDWILHEVVPSCIDEAVKEVLEGKK